MSRKKQVVDGLKQISQGAMRVLGLTKILSLLSPYFTTFEANTKAGLKQIKDGVKHILGTTDAQRLTKWLDTHILASYDSETRELLRGFYTNLYKYYVMESQVGSNVSRTLSSYDLVAASKHIMDNVGAHALIGVQPMMSPVGTMLHMAVTEHHIDPPAPIIGEKTALDVPPGRKLSFQIQDIIASVGSRHLKGSFSIEAAQSINADLDIKQTILNAIADTAATDIDNQLMTTISNVATAHPTIKETDGVDMGVMLGIHINKLANAIATATRRGAGNWAVLSTKAFELLQGQQVLELDAESVKVGILKRVGTLNHTMVIYVCDEAAQDVLVGYKGTKTEIDTGMIYGPYIPLNTSGVVVSPDTFEPMMRMYTRFALQACSNASSYYMKFDIE